MERGKAKYEIYNPFSSTLNQDYLIYSQIMVITIPIYYPCLLSPTNFIYSKLILLDYLDY